LKEAQGPVFPIFMTVHFSAIRLKKRQKIRALLGPPAKDRKEKRRTSKRRKPNSRKQQSAEKESPNDKAPSNKMYRSIKSIEGQSTELPKVMQDKV